MYETAEDVENLRRLIESSIEHAGPYLRKALEMPERSLSAKQLVAVFDQDRTVVLATTTSKCEPRVAPIGAVLVRGHFMIPTLRTSARCRHIARNPAVSLSYHEGNELAVIVHGSARLVGPDGHEFAEAESLQRQSAKTSVSEWGRPGEAVFVRVEATRLFTFAREPQRYG